MESKWKIVGASTLGKAHIESETPCQDAHNFDLLDNLHGIAIVSDGAGSCENSQIGSKFVVEKTMKQMKTLLQNHPLLKEDYDPKENEWRDLMFKEIKILQDGLNDLAEEQGVDYKSLSCTFILLLFSPHRILSCHIGDGRAGYLGHKGDWKSLFSPFKGEQVGQTVFITSDIFNGNEEFIETTIVNDAIHSFTLLSDGCELACWKCYDKHIDEEFYFDPNEPYSGFFNPCISALKSMHCDKLSQKDIHLKWSKFLESGNETFEKEMDDKTMILGTIIVEEECKQITDGDSTED